MATIHDYLQGRGAKARLARALGVTHAAIRQWKAVPADRVLTVERITGISRYELRPDIFGTRPQRRKAA